MTTRRFHQSIRCYEMHHHRHHHHPRRRRTTTTVATTIAKRRLEKRRRIGGRPEKNIPYLFFCVILVLSMLLIVVTATHTAVGFAEIRQSFQRQPQRQRQRQPQVIRRSPFSLLFLIPSSSSSFDNNFPEEDGEKKNNKRGQDKDQDISGQPQRNHYNHYYHQYTSPQKGKTRELNFSDDEKNKYCNETINDQYRFSSLEMPSSIVNTLFNVSTIQQWLNTTLNKVEVSDIEWVQNMGDILTIHPSVLIQEQLDHLQGLGSSSSPSSSMIDTSTSMDRQYHHDGLVNNDNMNDRQWAQTKFDFEYRRCLLQVYSSSFSLSSSSSSSSSQECDTGTFTTTMATSSSDVMAELLQRGQSNTHPMGLSLVAIPPNTTYQWETVSPARQVLMPLVGSIQHSSSYDSTGTTPIIPPDTLSRQPHHCIGTPLSNFSHPPRDEELQKIAIDLQSRIVSELQQLQEEEEEEEETMISIHPSHYEFGSAIIQPIGSVHSIWTNPNEGCLLFVLGAHLPFLYLSTNTKQK